MGRKLKTIKVSRTMWKVIVWTPMLLGLIIFSVFNSTFFIPGYLYKWSVIASGGGFLIGLGMGFVYARVFNIKGID